MKQVKAKKSLSISRRIDRSVPYIDQTTQAEIVAAPALMYPPKDKVSLHRLADELVAWCRLSDCLTINSFPISRGYNPYRFFRSGRNDEYFDNAVGLAKAIIIDRLEVGLHNGKYDRSIFMARLPLYDPMHRELQLENIKLQREADGSRLAQNFRIEIAPAESSVLVPHKDNNEMD